MTTSDKTRRELPTFLICPDCRTPLTADGDTARCPVGHRFPTDGGIVDFLPGQEAADADWAEGRTAADRTCGHHAETENLDHRIDQYILPFIDARFPDRGAVRVLDDGTGLGRTVALLVERGLDAYGIDPGSRREGWDGTGLSERLYSASGTRLPFADQTFHVVLSSGVLEHVGEHLPPRQRAGPCADYVHEALRVLRPGGFALLAAPNGLHPVDYWHTGSRALRLHSPFERWMPRPHEIRGWVASSPVPGRLTFLSPGGFLAFQTIRRHVYGRLFSRAMKCLFDLMDRLPVLARTPLNPWLVAAVEREPAEKGGSDLGLRAVC